MMAERKKKSTRKKKTETNKPKNPTELFLGAGKNKQTQMPKIERDS